MVNNPPYNAGDMGQGTKIPHATGQLSSRASTKEPAHGKPQSPRALEPAHHTYRARVTWSLSTTTREEKETPHATTREKPTRRNENSCVPQGISRMPQLRPNAAKNKLNT